MEESNTHVFSGKDFSSSQELEKERKKTEDNEKDIRQNLMLLFITAPGELVHRFDYGCSLRRYAFETMNAETLERIRQDIERAVAAFEPRIELEEVTFEERTSAGVLLIHLRYMIRNSDVRSDMMYPLYLNEETDLNL